MFVNKSWGPDFDNQTASALGAAWHDAVEAVAGQGRTCTASVKTIPNGSQTSLDCGAHRLQLFSSDDSSYMTHVTESLGADR